MNRYEVDLDRARRLLDEAGYPPDADGVRFTAILDYPQFHAESLATGAACIRLQLRRWVSRSSFAPPLTSQAGPTASRRGTASSP